MLIQGKLLSYGDDLSEPFEIRRKVFVEEQGISKEIEFDYLDAEAMHVVVYEDKDIKRAVATGRIIYDGLICNISRVAVLKEDRNTGYGDFAIRMLLNKAVSAGIKEVTIKTNNSCVEFFKKIGFQVQGSAFMEVGILYYNMIIYTQDIATLCKISAK